MTGLPGVERLAKACPYRFDMPVCAWASGRWSAPIQQVTVPPNVPFRLTPTSKEDTGARTVGRGSRLLVGGNIPVSPRTDYVHLPRPARHATRFQPRPARAARSPGL